MDRLIDDKIRQIMSCLKELQIIILGKKSAKSCYLHHNDAHHGLLHRSLLILKYNKMSYIRAIPKLISPLTRPLLSATPRKSVVVRTISLTKINNTNNDQSVEVIYKKHTGEEFPTTTRLGENLLDVMVNNKLVDELQPGFGACEGTLACSTCHLIFSEEDYKKLEEPTDEELDVDVGHGQRSH